MALYHCSVKTFSRSKGQSATAAVAYRLGARIECEREGVTHDYRSRSGVASTFTVSPSDAPEWAHDPAKLWNAAEAAEKRINSTVAREVEVALPCEASEQDRKQIVWGLAKDLVTRYGVAVTVAIHDPSSDGDQRNHHAHMLMTTRAIGPEGFGAKTRILDAAKTGSAEIEWIRHRVAQHHKAFGFDVDHRSFERQNLDIEPTRKMGPAASGMERKARRKAEAESRPYKPVTRIGVENEAVAERNTWRAGLRRTLKAAQERVDKLQAQLAEWAQQARDIALARSLNYSNDRLLAAAAERSQQIELERAQERESRPEPEPPPTPKRSRGRGFSM